MEALQFEWDDTKNEINKTKHKVSFELASLVFCDPNRIERYDDLHSENEGRYISIGRVQDILVVVHTDRGKAIRIISARFADKKERDSYYGQVDY